jgi:hypothetical protein
MVHSSACASFEGGTRRDMGRKMLARAQDRRADCWGGFIVGCYSRRGNVKIDLFALHPFYGI